MGRTWRANGRTDGTEKQTCPDSPADVSQKIQRCRDQVNDTLSRHVLNARDTGGSLSENKSYCEASSAKTSVRHNNEFANEAFRHEVGLGLVKIRQAIDATNKRLDLVLFDVANEAAKIATRPL